MKHARKLASLLLALVMVFALATTAFAEGETTGNITVDNPIADQTYTAYKIFDVVYDTEGHYSYTIDSTSEWFTTVQAYATEANGLTLTQANGSTTYIVTTADAFSAPGFANALKAAVSGKTGNTLTAQDDGTVSVSGLPLGYYFVSSSTGALCNLTTTTPTVTIHDENDIPFKKDADTTTAFVGDDVTYTITGKVPDYTGFTTYTYLITDTMSEGLTFNKDVKVTVGGNDVTSDCTITYDVDNNANKFTVSIPVMSYTIGAEIKVTYSAEVNMNALEKVTVNSATLKYSNDPLTDGTGTITTDPVPVYSSKIVIDKYQDGNENIKLAGATFVLYWKTTFDPPYDKLYYNQNNTTNRVHLAMDRVDATPVTTNENGVASFVGLHDGTYYLEEITAPDGYNLLTEPVQVTVDGSKATIDDPSALTVTVKVANSTGSILPSTGGMGTTIFYVLGSILAVGAIVLLVTKKRMSTNG